MTDVDKTPARRVKAEHTPLCRHCGVALLTLAESRLGIHVRCVYEVEKRQQVARIPKPGYRGFR